MTERTGRCGPLGEKGGLSSRQGVTGHFTIPQDLSDKGPHLGSLFQEMAGLSHVNSRYCLSRLRQKPAQAKLLVFSFLADTCGLCSQDQFVAHPFSHVSL